MKAIDGSAPQALTTALFLTFVYIADAEDTLTSREVEGLNKLLRDPHWADDALMRAALADLAVHYTALWKAYDAHNLTRDGSRLAVELARALSGLDARTADGVRAALRNFAQRIADSGSPLLARLGVGTATRARQSSLREFENLLADVPTAIAPASTNVESETVAPFAMSASFSSSRNLSHWPAAQLTLSQENSWKRGRTRLRCVRVTPETHDVKTFTFVADPSRVFTYKPGQFITIEVPIDGKVMRRSYTISSSPSRPYTLTITVKRAQNSIVSKWLHSNVAPGFELDISGPHGNFSCLDAPAEKMLFIGAGSGITPLMSMLRWLSDTASPANVILINNVRTPNDVIFERELLLLASKLGDNLRLGIVPVQVLPGQVWNGPTGRFNENLLCFFAADFMEREIFVCGPTGYMESVKGLLDGNGFPAQRFHQESFGVAPTPMPIAAETPVPAKTNPVPPAKPMTPAATFAAANNDAACEVVFAKSGKTIRCGAEDFILEIAEEHGMELANSCRAGNCGTCRVSKVEGTVLMGDQTALTEEDIQSGMVVICVGRAQGRVVLDA